MTGHDAVSQWEDEHGWRVRCECGAVFPGSSRGDALERWEGHRKVVELRQTIDKAKGESRGADS